MKLFSYFSYVKLKIFKKGPCDKNFANKKCNIFLKNGINLHNIQEALFTIVVLILKIPF